MTNNLRTRSGLFGIAGIFLFSVLVSCTQKAVDVKGNEEYDVAAYVWPSCHDEPMIREKLWDEGIGEWEIIQKGIDLALKVRSKDDADTVDIPIDVLDDNETDGEMALSGSER